MKFALFFLGEYVNSLAVSLMFTVLFLGGYAGPVLPPYVWLLVKTAGVFAILMWLRGTLPRVRVDQLMSFNWKFLVPMSIINIIVVMFLGKLFAGAAPEVLMVVLFLSGVAILLIALTMVARQARVLRTAEEHALELRQAENRMVAAAHLH